MSEAQRGILQRFLLVTIVIVWVNRERLDIDGMTSRAWTTHPAECASSDNGPAVWHRSQPAITHATQFSNAVNATSTIRVCYTNLQRDVG